MGTAVVPTVLTLGAVCMDRTSAVVRPLSTFGVDICAPLLVWASGKDSRSVGVVSAPSVLRKCDEYRCKSRMEQGDMTRRHMVKRVPSLRAAREPKSRRLRCVCDGALIKCTASFFSQGSLRRPAQAQNIASRGLNILFGQFQKVQQSRTEIEREESSVIEDINQSVGKL